MSGRSPAPGETRSKEESERSPASEGVRQEFDRWDSSRGVRSMEEFG